MHVDAQLSPPTAVLWLPRGLREGHGSWWNYALLRGRTGEEVLVALKEAQVRLKGEFGGPRY